MAWKHWLAAFTGLALVSSGMAASLAAAQPLAAHRDVRAQLGVSIPLGGNRARSDARPNVYLGVEHAPVSDGRAPDLPLDQFRTGNLPLQRRLSLTLHERPTLLVNGRAVDARHQARLNGLETAGVVAGGVVLVLGVAYLVLIDMQDDCGGGQDCN